MEVHHDRKTEMQEVWTDPKFHGKYCSGIGSYLRWCDRETAEESGSYSGKAEFGEGISERWYE